MKTILILPAVLLGITLVCSCHKDETTLPTTEKYFPKVKTIIQYHCLSCHSASGSGTFGGGRLGPQLNAAPGKYGKNLASTIENPAFPSMVNVFAKKALTPEEAFQVAAYLHSVGTQPPPRKHIVFPIVGFVGLLGSLALGGHLGRNRFRGGRNDPVPTAEERL